MRVTVRVRPGASRTAVGGRYGDSDTLVVAVTARAVDGAATEAVRLALADAFGVRPKAVSLVSGATSRTKIFDIDAGDDKPSQEATTMSEGGQSLVSQRLAALLTD